MLKKLIRYDLSSTLKFLIIFYGLAVVFGISTRLISNFSDSLAVIIIREICLGASISMMCSTLINNIMRMWVRFKNNLYGDESYLSHTLPIKKSTHYLSKILATVVSFFISFLVISLVVVIVFYSKENLKLIKDILFPFAEIYNSSIVKILTAFLLVLFLEFLNILQCGFTGIILGHRMNNLKLGFSVIYGFLSFIVSQTAVIGIFLLIGLINKDFMGLFVANATINIDIIRSSVIIAILSYIFIIAVFCFINIKLLKKGVNVD